MCFIWLVFLYLVALETNTCHHSDAAVCAVTRDVYDKCTCLPGRTEQVTDGAEGGYCSGHSATHSPVTLIAMADGHF